MTKKKINKPRFDGEYFHDEDFPVGLVRIVGFWYKENQNRQEILNNGINHSGKTTSVNKTKTNADKGMKKNK
jgi:hypothetical protein